MAYGKDRTATSTGDWNKIPTARGESLESKESNEQDSVELWQLETGDVVRIIADDGRLPYGYEFTIMSANLEPLVVITQTNPDGSTVSSGDKEFRLRGSGRWVGREWPLWKYNNDRSDGRQIMINYGKLSVGGEIVLLDPELPYGDNSAVLMPAISTIEVIKYDDTLQRGLTEDTTPVTITK
jgi:hypothetical protein